MSPKLLFGLALGIVSVAAAVLAGVLFVVASGNDTERAKVQIEAIQIFVVGLAVGLAAVIVPAIATWNREQFERYKESRMSYTRASTGVRYLPHRLAALGYADAMKLINEVHEYKHIAETYDELEQQFARRSGNKTQDQWSTNMWETLEAYTAVVSRNPENWDEQPRSERLKILEDARTEVETRIGSEKYHT